MKPQISWKVGGQQGEGIESTGEIFATAMNRKGYYLYGYRHFSSRIKGGHTNNKIRVSTSPVHAISDDLDILVAFDQETIELNHHEMREDSIIIADAKAKPSKPEHCRAQLIELPLTLTAKELGTALMKNMVAIGATCAVMKLDTTTFETLITNMFTKKGQKVVEMNIEALHQGYELMKDKLDTVNGDYLLEDSEGTPHLYMIGNDAIGLGAISAGSRFIAGVRAFTASAGPGLSLMMEAIGLSGMTETPLVIVNTQRGGPSTGLPTKQEQSDLMQMIYGTHGDIPKIVVAPTDAEDAFYLTMEAFNLAEEYQCPVIVLSDLQLSLGKQTVKQLDYNRIQIKRGELIQSDIERDEDDRSYFKRYALTTSGISQRPIPGVKGGIHHVTGVEHNQEGKPSEAADNRREQMEKRMSKTANLLIETPVDYDEKHEKADILYIGFISSKGAIEEGSKRLNNNGIKVNTMQIRQLHPLPKDIIQQAIDKASSVIVAEHNYQGQLSNILKMNTAIQDKLVNQTKYDGTPFLPHEIEEKGLSVAKDMKEMM